MQLVMSQREEAQDQMHPIVQMEEILPILLHDELLGLHLVVNMVELQWPEVWSGITLRVVLSVPIHMLLEMCLPSEAMGAMGAKEESKGRAALELQEDIRIMLQDMEVLEVHLMLGGLLV